MLQRRPTASRIVEYSSPEERVDIPSSSTAATGRSSAGIVSVLWRRKWIVLCCGAVAVAAGIVYLMQATKVYASSAQIYIAQRAQNPFTDQFSASMNAMNYLQTQCDVIRSSTVLLDALKRPEINRAQSLETAENPVALLKYAVSATVGKQSDIITVTAESPYPDDAAVISNSVVQAYIDYENRMHRSTAAEIVTALENEKSREDADYKQTSARMLAFKRAHGSASFEHNGEGNITIKKLSDLSTALTQVQIEAMQATVAAESANAFKDNPAKIQQMMATSRFTGMEGSAGLRQEMNLLEIQLQDLKANYGPNYPAAQTLERRLERVRAMVTEADQQAISTFVAGLNEQAAAAKKRVDQLQAAFNAQQKEALEVNAQAAEYAQFEMDLARSQKVLEFLNTRINEFGISSKNDEPNSISILESAKPGDLPVRPNRLQVLAIALAVGLMAGLGGALLLDWMDHRIRSAAEVESLLGLPILGAVPHMIGKRNASERGQEIHLYPKSEVAEAYRTVRTGIRFGVTDASSRTLLVTSPSPGDGKTTVASNLAIAIAQTGKRVLLVDADCRRPMIHRVYGMDAAHGLSSVLAGQSDLETSILASQAPNLDILPCGPLPPNPAEMLNSEAFTSLLRELASRYDQVVVDSPPVAPVTDARILGAACDATVLVIRAEKTSRRVAEHARDALASVGAVLLGVVVNDAPRSRSDVGGYGHYHYGYGYGYGSKSRSKEVKAISVAKPVSTT